MNNIKNNDGQGPEIKPRMTIISFFLIVLSLLFPVIQVNADAGKLDPAFGDGGKVITDFGGEENGGGIAIQKDGRIIVVGTTNIGTFDDFALARYLPNGHLDQHFGHNGKVTTNFSNSADSASGIAIQPDGKIVVVGTFNGQSGELDYRFAAARYLPNGALDRSFGANGKVTTRFAGNFASANGVALQPDGKIVVAGFAVDARYDFALVRYLRNGSLDESFGNHVRVLFSFFGTKQNQAIANAVAVQKNGKIIVAGWASFDFNTSDTFGTEGVFAVARLCDDGKLDRTFGYTGRVITDFGNPDKLKFSFDGANSLVIQPDGRIVVAGNGTHGENTVTDFVLVRYEKNGHLDQSFGVKGKVATDILGNHDEIKGIALQRNGDIIAAGDAQGFTDYSMALTRYKPDGKLDPDFGEGGKLTIHFYGSDYAAAVALQNNEKILVAGTAHRDNTPVLDFALARYLAR